MQVDSISTQKVFLTPDFEKLMIKTVLYENKRTIALCARMDFCKGSLGSVVVSVSDFETQKVADRLRPLPLRAAALGRLCTCPVRRDALTG